MPHPSLILLAVALNVSVVADGISYRHGTSFIEPLKYPAGFQHFEQPQTWLCMH